MSSPSPLSRYRGAREEALLNVWFVSRVSSRLVWSISSVSTEMITRRPLFLNEDHTGWAVSSEPHVLWRALDLRCWLLPALTPRAGTRAGPRGPRLSGAGVCASAHEARGQRRPRHPRQGSESLATRQPQDAGARQYHAPFSGQLVLLGPRLPESPGPRGCRQLGSGRRRPPGRLPGKPARPTP